MQISIYKVNLYIVLVIQCFYVFKQLAIHLHIDILGYIIIALSVFMNLVIFFNRSVIASQSRNILVFIIVGIMSFALSAIMNSPVVASIGFAGTYIHLIFWFLVFSNTKKDNRWILFLTYIRINLIFATFISLFAYYQYFFDSSLFGVNPHSIYGNLDIDPQFENITRRATSFIGSPQNLGIYIAISSISLFLISLNNIIKILLFGIFIFCAILAASKAFFMFIFVFLITYAFMTVKHGTVVKYLFISFLGITFIYSLIVIKYLPSFWEAGFLGETLNDTFISAFAFHNRIIKGVQYEYNLTTFLKYTNLFSLLFGHGLGISDRLVEVIIGREAFTSWVAGAESYVIKIFYEMGLSGILAFCYSCYISLSRARKGQRIFSRCYFPLLCALFMNLLLTPSFTGLGISYIAWPLILVTVMCDQTTITNKRKNRIFKRIK